MPSIKKTIVKKPKIKHIGILCFLTLVFGTAVSFLVTKNTFSASGAIFTRNVVRKSYQPSIAPSPEETPLLAKAAQPQQEEATRIKIVIGETQEVPVSAASQINSVVVVSPDIASAEVKTGNLLAITGLKIGETILIIADSQKRLTLIVHVTGKPSIAERRKFIAENTESAKAVFSGKYDVLYVHGFDGSPSLVRQKIDYRRKLSKEKTLRVSGEMFKFINQTDREEAFAKVQNFGMDRLSVGIDSPDKSIDFLDSQIHVSTLSFNNYPMRGFHLVTNSEFSADKNQPSGGFEVFAGMARPSLTLYDNHEGYIAGGMMPVVNKRNVRARAGIIGVFPQKNNRVGKGGGVFHFDGSYVPSKNFSMDGETSFANGEFSWRGRSNVKFKNFSAFGEIVRFDKQSPLNSIGAQPGGRKTEAFGFNWRPFSRLNASVSYNHTEIERLMKSGLADFERSNFMVIAGYRLNRNSTLKFRFLDQQIETAATGNDMKFQIDTRAVSIGHEIRFNRNWSNSFEARLNFSREITAGAEMENGFALIEQLRFSFGRHSATGFFNYTYNTPSLTSLIIRNPQVLPPLLREAFTQNPVEFLQIYRDRLAFLLPGIELPQTRNLDAGIRFQTAVSRFTVTGETRYSSGEILSRRQNSLFASVGLNVQIDRANSFQINGWQSFGAGNQSALTFSYTHRFGTEAGDGFQFSKLLGFERGRIQGRVYYDLNGNGVDDANEPGVAGITVQINGNRSVKTDALGRYQLSADKGVHNVAMISDNLGIRLRASSATEQRVSVASRQTAIANFGVSDFGFVSGRIFNDANQTGEMPPNPQGVAGMRIIVRSSDTEKIIAEQISDGTGTYRFSNLRPGNYTIEIDRATLPANFRLPAQTFWQIRVLPLQGYYLDIPIAAQRAIAGFIFVDADNDGKFDPQKDKPVKGALITGGGSFAVSDENGAYILRNLSAGQIKLIVRSPQGTTSSPVFLELDAEPVTKRAVNLIAQR